MAELWPFIQLLVCQWLLEENSPLDGFCATWCLTDGFANYIIGTGILW